HQGQIWAGTQDERDVLRASPDLALVQAADAFAKHFDGAVAAEDAARAGAESIENNFRLLRIEQHDRANIGAGAAHLTQKIEAIQRLAIEGAADGENIYF